MEKTQSLTILVASFCVFFLLGIASAVDGKGKDTLFIEGQVYCDTCGIGFPTRVSEWMAGAKVVIQCTDPTSKEKTLDIQGVTNSTGWYRIEVEGDHEDESCLVALIDSPRKDCGTCQQRRDSARLVLTNNVGIASNCRLINPLGFQISEPLPICKEIVKELDLA